MDNSDTYGHVHYLTNCRDHDVYINFFVLCNAVSHCIDDEKIASCRCVSVGHWSRWSQVSTDSLYTKLPYLVYTLWSSYRGCVHPPISCLICRVTQLHDVGKLLRWHSKTLQGPWLWEKCSRRLVVSKVACPTWTSVLLCRLWMTCHLEIR